MIVYFFLCLLIFEIDFFLSDIHFLLSFCLNKSSSLEEDNKEEENNNNNKKKSPILTFLSKLD